MRGSPLTYLPHISNKGPGVSQAKKKGVLQRKEILSIQWGESVWDEYSWTHPKFVGLGGGGGELEEFLKEQYYLSPRSVFIIKNVLQWCC